MTKIYNQPQEDDLTQITGVSPLIADILRKYLHITTFEALANLHYEQVSRAARSADVHLSMRTIKHLLAHARQLVQQRHTVSPPPFGNYDAQGPIATFIVEYRRIQDREHSSTWITYVHHMEADRTAVWTGISGRRLARWLIQELRRLSPAK